MSVKPMTVKNPVPQRLVKGKIYWFRSVSGKSQQVTCSLPMPDNGFGYVRLGLQQLPVKRFDEHNIVVWNDLPHLEGSLVIGYLYSSERTLRQWQRLNGAWIAFEAAIREQNKCRVMPPSGATVKRLKLMAALLGLKVDWRFER